MYILALALVCQWLEPEPAPGIAGEPVTVVVRAPGGATLPDVAVELRAESGASRVLGRSDAAGQVRFSVEQAGAYELRAELPERELWTITPYYVLEPPRRWLWGIVCLPAGVLLTWWNLRNWRRSKKAAAS